MASVESKDMVNGDGPNSLATKEEAQAVVGAQIQDMKEEQQLKTRLQQNEAAGASVHEFDANATPEEKAQQAKKMMNGKGINGGVKKTEGAGELER